MLHLQSPSTTLRSVRTHGESYTGTSTKMTPATLEYAYQFADDGYQTLIQTSQVSGQSPAVVPINLLPDIRHISASGRGRVSPRATGKLLQIVVSKKRKTLR